MTEAIRPPQTIAQVIDHIERIQEELLMVQRSLEKLEPVEPSEQKSK